MIKRGFTAWQIKDLSAPTLSLRRNGGWERLRLDGFAPANPSATSTPSVGSLSLSACALSSSFAFTLAEVLITLAIIGVVAALTIPTVVRNYQTMQYKTAYKKAYSDLSRAFASAIAFNELEPRSDFYDYKASQSEWAVMKKNFKVIKDCPAGTTFSCWVDADRVCTGSCTSSEEGAGGAPNGGAAAFIDASGRAWAHYASNHSIYLVDTNGDKSPNQFGKDRWMFSTTDAKNNSVTSGLPAKIAPFILTDYLTKNNWCQHAPCYYKSWLTD